MKRPTKMNEREIKDVNGVLLEVGQMVGVFCCWNSERGCGQTSKTLGRIVAYNNEDGMAVHYQGDDIGIEVFLLVVVELVVVELGLRKNETTH